MIRPKIQEILNSMKNNPDKWELGNTPVTNSLYFFYFLSTSLSLWLYIKQTALELKTLAIHTRGVLEITPIALTAEEIHQINKALKVLFKIRNHTATPIALQQSSKLLDSLPEIT